MNDARQIAWMRRQWRRFLFSLWVATAAVWVLGLAAVLTLDEGAWGVRWGLVFLLLATGGACIRFSLGARRQLKRLKRLADDLRFRQTDGPGRRVGP